MRVDRILNWYNVLCEDVFRNFFTEHAEVFEGAPPVLAAGEHNLAYYNLFQVYLKLYEVKYIYFELLKSIIYISTYSVSADNT